MQSHSFETVASVLMGIIVSWAVKSMCLELDFLRFFILMPSVKVNQTSCIL